MVGCDQLFRNISRVFDRLIQIPRKSKRILNPSRGLSIVSKTFKQNIYSGYDLVFVLIIGSVSFWFEK